MDPIAAVYGKRSSEQGVTENFGHGLPPQSAAYDLDFTISQKG